MNSIKQPTTPELDPAHLIRKKVLDPNFEIPPVTEKKKAKIERETGIVAKVFNDFGRPWFLCGGTSLEFAQGKITLDHQDTDVGLFYEDIADFFDYAVGLGYKFITSECKDILSKESLLAQKENAFLRIANDTQSGLTGFEIMFLRRNDEGEIIFGSSNKVAFPATLYEGGQKYIAENGQEVPLTPKEVQILYKIFDGRQKDFYEIKTFLPTLSQQERQRLDTYLKNIGAVFIVGNKETKNIDELISLVEETTLEAKEEFLSSEIDKVVSEAIQMFDGSAKKCLDIASRTDSIENFITEAKKEFGIEVVERRISEFNAVAQLLFSENKPTLEELRQFVYHTFNLEQYIEEQTRISLLDVRRWEIRTDKP